MSTEMMQAALAYAERGWPVFPVKVSPDPDRPGKFKKQPLTPHGHLDATTDPDKIRKWSWPGIGMPTGQCSGMWVADVDLPAGPTTLATLEFQMSEFLPSTMEQETPTGGTHKFFRCQPGAKIKNSASELGPGLDIRGEGGWAVLAPTRSTCGAAYRWINDLPPAAGIHWLAEMARKDTQPAPAPPVQKSSTTPYGAKALESEAARVALASEGTRNDILNRAAFAVWQLVAGGEIDSEEAESTLLMAATRAGLSETEARRTLASGRKSGEQEPRTPEIVNTVNKPGDSSTPSTIVNKSGISSTSVNTRQQTVNTASTATTPDVAFLVDQFIEQATGIFAVSEICQWADLKTREQKQAVSQALLRRIKSLRIERAGGRHGHYRRVERECPQIDYLSASTEPVNIWLAFGLNELVSVMPGNTILVAGEQNSGKTAFNLNVIRQNQDRFEIHYFNSEMGASELRKRLAEFEVPLSSWKFHAWERQENFGDVIRPGEGIINIIDFLEVHDNFYLVGQMLAQIHAKLHGALAIVSLQKNVGTDIGLGGGRTLEKPRIALALSPGRVKITKAKNWASNRNPNGLVREFKLVNGCRIMETSDWYKPEPQNAQITPKAARKEAA
jgi:hypothetical protein